MEQDSNNKFNNNYDDNVSVNNINNLSYDGMNNENIYVSQNDQSYNMISNIDTFQQSINDMSSGNINLKDIENNDGISKKRQSFDVYCFV